MKKRKSEGEGHIFQEKWEDMYYFSVGGHKSVCLICSKVMSAPKEYNLRRNYGTYIHIHFVFLRGI
jgi:hypothetical protein